jgi:decaprenylphospho-beta-D-ribofuranose 2-oxidase
MDASSDRQVAGVLANGKPQRLSGWGRIAPSEALVVSLRSPEQVLDALAAARRAGGLIARGAGCSYGDAAQNEGGVVADLSGLREVEILPPSLSGSNGRELAAAEPPLVRAGAGAALRDVMRALARMGLALPVVPGTSHITIGGAIAADVHGKNHPREGSFCDHVQSILLATPARGMLELSREQEPELFFATIGGMGLTGVIVEATMRPRPATAQLDGDVDRVDTLQQALSVMACEEGHDHAIAWVDLLSGGRSFGRSVVLRCRERPLGAEKEQRVRLPGRRRLLVPRDFPGWVLGAGVVRAFNALRWHRAPQRAIGVRIGAGDNLFPLDALGQWSRLYGKGGLVQYQFAVPEQQRGAIVEVAELLRSLGQPMYLAVVKRFGEPSGGLLSFPQRGWTLAIDLPAASSGLMDALDEADELVVSAGGRVYLAKDARLRPELLARMYPQLRRFREARDAVDPDSVLRSDMAVRLGLAQADRG